MNNFQLFKGTFVFVVLLPFLTSCLLCCGERSMPFCYVREKDVTVGNLTCVPGVSKPRLAQVACKQL